MAKKTVAQIAREVRQRLEKEKGRKLDLKPVGRTSSRLSPVNAARRRILAGEGTSADSTLLRNSAELSVTEEGFKRDARKAAGFDSEEGGRSPSRAAGEFAGRIERSLFERQRAFDREKEEAEDAGASEETAKFKATISPVRAGMTMEIDANLDSLALARTAADFGEENFDLFVGQFDEARLAVNAYAAQVDSLLANGGDPFQARERFVDLYGVNPEIVTRQLRGILDRMEFHKNPPPPTAE